MTALQEYKSYFSPSNNISVVAFYEARRLTLYSGSPYEPG